MKLSRFDLGMIIAFVLVGIAGGVLYYFTDSALSEMQTQAKDAGSKTQSLRAQPIFPDAKNVKVLGENIRVMQAALEELTEKRLSPPGNTLAKVAASDPTAWKQNELNPKVHDITTLAESKGVGLPKNFYLGFSRYVRASPTQKEATVVLEKQLIGLSQLSTLLIAAGVNEIESIKRTFDEDGPESGATAGSTGSDEMIHGRSIDADQGLYRVYPFEVAFVCSPDSFRDFLNSLENSPYLFVIRWVRVNNSSPASPRLEDLVKISTGGGAESAATRSGGGGGGARGPVFIFGSEKLKVVAHIDLAEWTAKTAKK